MKRYLLFGGRGYYPDGGWGDFMGDYDSVDDALAACEALMSKRLGTSLDWKTQYCDEPWREVVDSESREVVIRQAYKVGMGWVEFNV